MCLCWNSSLSFVHFQHMAVGKHDLACVSSGKPNWCAIFGGSESDRDLVTRLERDFVPTIAVQNAGTLRFNSPIHDFALVILNVEKNLDMRIGPHYFGHGSRNRDGMNLVVSHISMVRQERTAKGQKTYDQGEGRYQLSVHILPRGFNLRLRLLVDTRKVPCPADP